MVFFCRAILLWAMCPYIAAASLSENLCIQLDCLVTSTIFSRPFIVVLDNGWRDYFYLTFCGLLLRTFKVSKDLCNNLLEFSVWFMIKCWLPLWNELLLQLTAWLDATTLWLGALWQYKSLRWLTKPKRFFSYINVDNATTSLYIGKC